VLNRTKSSKRRRRVRKKEGKMIRSLLPRRKTPKRRKKTANLSLK
jgi:hypothetical protein